MRVYLAGPLTTGDPESNVKTAEDYFFEIIRMGYQPFCPHLTWRTDSRQRDAIGYERWMELDFAWLRQADVVFALPGASPGTDREVVFARKCRIPVVTNLAHLDALADIYPS